jgi:hypothetical protein
MNSHRCNKALLITFYFPPYNTIAAVRLSKFAKYLPDFGWDPVVLTANNIYGLDSNLPLEIDESKITRTPYFCSDDILSRMMKKIRREDNRNTSKVTAAYQSSSHPSLIALKFQNVLSYIMSLPVIDKLINHPMGWYEPAVKAGLEIVKTNDIKVILSSYGPSVSHFIGSKLHRETGIPWIADYRDNWIDEYRKHPQPFHFFDQQWEKHTIKRCSAIVSHTQSLAKILEKSHGKIPSVIPNGFDDADFKCNISLTSKFTITYTGSIYPGKRDPSPVLQALFDARQEGRITPQEIEIRFYGQNVNATIAPLVAKYHVEDFVVLGSNIPYKESIKKQMESTILLLLSWNNPLDVGTLNGKIFEYLGANRPILAIAYPDGEIDNILKKSGTGIVANTPEEIKKNILVWVDEYKNTGGIKSHFHPEYNIINSFTRKEETRLLANIFNEIAGKNV